MAYIEAAVMGRLGGEPTHRQTQGGKPFITFTLAVTDKGSEDTEWVNVSAFEDVAAEMPADAGKGERVYVEGKARVNRWTTKEGAARANLQVTATRLVVMDRIGRRKAKDHWAPGARRPRDQQQPAGAYDG